MARANFTKTKQALFEHVVKSLQPGLTFFDTKNRAFTVKGVVLMPENDELCVRLEDGTNLNIVIS